MFNVYFEIEHFCIYYQVGIIYTPVVLPDRYGEVSWHLQELLPSRHAAEEGICTA